jgi:hypothetical protein
LNLRGAPEIFFENTLGGQICPPPHAFRSQKIPTLNRVKCVPDGLTPELNQLAGGTV